MRKVAIIGSCVSRDPFDEPDLEWPEIAFYSARSSLGSAFQQAPFPLTLEELDPDSLVTSRWQRRMIQQDLTKGLAEAIANSASDGPAFVIDFIDERFDLLERDGRFATYSAELRGKSAPHRNLGINLVKSGTERHFGLWKDGLARFRDIVDGAPIVLNNVLWAAETEDGAPTKDRSAIDAQNEILCRMYDHAASIGIDGLFDKSFPFVAASHHRWGVAPFHYTPQVYQAFHRSLVGRLDV